MEKATQQLKMVWDDLPIKLKEYIRSDEWWQRLNTAWTNYSLTEEQKEKIGDEVLLVLLGLTDPDDLSLAFQATADLPAEQAKKLALGLETAVLATVNDELATLDPLVVEDYRSGLKAFDPALAKLPQNLQQMILSTDTAETVQAIGQKYHLHVDKMGVLDNEVGAVLVGETRPENFTSRLKEKLGLDQTTVQAITHEVNERIFLPLRETLKNSSLAPAVNPIPAANSTSSTAETSVGKTELSGQASKRPNTIFEKKLGQLFRVPQKTTEFGDPYLEKPE